MRTCPSCNQDKVDSSGRCTNTSCTVYCMRVLEEFSGTKCDGYGVRCQSTNAVRRRQNTAYDDDESNFNTLCEDCQEEADKYWDERWADYYSGCL